MSKNNKEKRPYLTIDELNLPPAPAKAPQIDWGEDFEAFDDTNKVIYLKKLCSALNHSADLVQQERNKAYEECSVMVEKCNNADKAVEIQKNIVRTAITNFNAEKQNLISRIQELEAEIKDLKIDNNVLDARLKRYED